MAYSTTGVFAWLVLGITAGCIAMAFYRGRTAPLRIFAAVPIGVLGAIFAGTLAVAFNLVHSARSWWSLVYAALGAVAAVMLLDLARGAVWRFRHHHYV